MILTKGLKQYWSVSFWTDNTGSFASCSKMCVLYTWCWIWIILTKVQKLEYTSCAKCCIRIPALWGFADRKFAAESMYTYMSGCKDHTEYYLSVQQQQSHPSFLHCNPRSLSPYFVIRLSRSLPPVSHNELQSFH
jgi:hypothetical protein